MLFGTSDPVRVKTGTTSPIYIPRTAGPVQVKPGDYFWIKVHSAQAAFRGSFFEQIKQLVVTSKVNLNHPLLGNEDFHAIQRSREVKKNRAEQLGLSSNLVSLVPATMTHVSISIEFIIDKENSLAKLGNLVNDDTFLAAVSLAPGAVAVAKTVGGLAQKIIQTFIPAEQRQPILQFAGDFDVGGTAGASSLQDGYYAILGTRDEENPLPSPVPRLEVRDSGLLADGKELNGLSYVVLDVTRVPARTRELSAGATWEAKLREAEGLAQAAADDPFAEDGEKKEVWGKCKVILQEARALLLADANYAPTEASDICKTVYKKIADLVSPKEDGKTKAAKGPDMQIDTKAERNLFGIGESEDLSSVSAKYAQTAAASLKILKAGEWL
jgi:hypothetical protein